MTERSSSKRGGQLAIVAAILVAMTGGALFGAIQVSRSVAENANSLHSADDAARAATIVRSHIAIANEGSDEQRVVSAAEAAASLGILEQSLADLSGVEGGPAAVASVSEFADLAGLDLEAMGDRTIDEMAIDESFRAAMASLDELREHLVTQLDVTDSSYQFIGIILGLAIAGLAPLLFFLWARSIARRTMEVRELSMKLEHERELRETRSNVLRTVVHEFRTPLTGIGGLAEILETPSMRRSEEGAEMVSMIRHEAEDMTRLTDDILVSEGLKSGSLEIHFEPVDVQDAVNQVMATFERRGVEVTAMCDPAEVWGDSLRLRQVLRNLVSNASKYGGPEIVIDGRLEESIYAIRVIDDGPGVPDEIVDGLFSPYPHRQNGTASSQSVGLGLAIVRQLAQAMGGVVRYRRVDDTTQFTLLLKAVVEEPSATKRPTAASVRS